MRILEKSSFLSFTTLQRVPLGASKIAQIVVQKGNREAERPNQGPKDPKVVRDQDRLALVIKVEELGAKDCLNYFLVIMHVEPRETSVGFNTAMVAKGRNAIVTLAMAFMDLLSFFKMWLSC